MKSTRPIAKWAMLALLLELPLWGIGQFVTPLAIPDTLTGPNYSLTIDREVHNFNENGADSSALNLDMNTFAYNVAGSTGNTYLGPTMIWYKGDSVTLTFTNNLDQPFGTSTGPYPAPTTVHLHGAHIPAWADGGPHGVIAPGVPRTVKFKVLDDACSLWYHPHGEDETYTQVEMGLAGMIIVKDPTIAAENLLPHRYGIDDFPLVVQDHVFDTVQGVQPRRYVGGIDTVRNQKTRTSVINGVHHPYLEVPPQNVRFRILDGSSRFCYQLGFGTIDGQGSHPMPFKMIGSDGGLLSDSARTITTFFTGPGIRNEVVVDFTGMAGQTFYLLNMYNLKPSDFIGPGGPEGMREPALMEIRVTQPLSNPVGIVPPLPNLVPYDANNPDTTRLKRLLGNGGPPPAPAPPLFSIDNNQYEFDVVNDIVREGDIEKWTIDNQSTIAHPFHIHDIQFYVTDVVNDSGLPVTPIPIEYLGRKDDIMVPVGWQITFVTKFEDFGRPKPFLPSNLDSAAYMYHCHILTHEDGYYSPTNGGATPADRQHHGMMQQFVVWNGLITSTEDPLTEDDFIVYPNPASHRLNLFGESNYASKVVIYDLQGKRLMEFDLAPFNGTVPIDVTDLPNGMILLEWQTTKGNATKKIVLN